MSHIIHPIFDECRKYTLDPYWQERFKQCSMNKFPRFMRYDSNRCIISIKRDIPPKIHENYSIDIQNPIKTYEMIMTIFRDILGLHSPRDIQISQEEIEDIKRKRVINLNCEWNKIKPKNIKEQLITNYVVTLQELYQLKPSEIRHLSSIIQIGFQFKNIQSQDIDYVNGVIKNISTLKFDETTRTFELSRKLDGKVKSEKYVQIDPIMKKLKAYIKIYNNRDG